MRRYHGHHTAPYGAPYEVFQSVEDSAWYWAPCFPRDAEPAGPFRTARDAWEDGQCV